MSENKSVLEQVLEHLLAEDEAKAKELLHGFMVEKSRDIYESLLDEDALEEAIEDVTSEEAVEEEMKPKSKKKDDKDMKESEESDEEAVEEAEESDDEAVEETVAGSPSEDFYDEVEANVGADESGVNEEDEDEMEPEMDMDDESDDKDDEEVEDRVDDLEAQLDELKAEFEKLMADEDGDDDMKDMDMADAEADLEDEMEMESVAEEEIDLDEEVEEELEEATQFSKEQKPVNDASGDHTASPKFPKKESFGTSEKELFGSDGGEGSKAGGAKDNPASDNIGEEPKAHPAPKVSAEKSESPIAGKVK